MSLANICRNQFSSRDIKRGAEYFATGAVNNLEVNDDRLNAEVAGSDYSPYDVTLDWSEADECVLKVACSCPRFADTGLCKHVFATILAADEQEVGPRRTSGNFIVEELGESDGLDDGYYADDDEYSPPPRRNSPTKRVTSGAAQKASSRKSGRRKAEPDSWKKRLAAVKNALARVDALVDLSGQRTGAPRQAWFLLNLNNCLAAGGLVVQLCCRERKRNGEFGKLKVMSLARKELSCFEDADDRDTLDLLLGLLPCQNYGYGSDYGGYRWLDHQVFSQIELSPTLGQIVLPRLCARGRMLWTERNDSRGPWTDDQGRPVAWDEGPPWQFRLHFDLDDKKKNWCVTGRLHRGDEAADVSRPHLVLPAGFMLLDDRLARVDWGGGAAWASGLRQTGPLVIPRGQADDFLEQFWQATSIPEVDMPAELRWEHATVAPRPKIVLKKGPDAWRRTDLEAKVTFEYEDHAVRLSDPAPSFIDRAARRVTRRDFAREQELLAHARDLGFKDADYYSRNRADWQLNERNLPRVVPALTSAGWQVEADGKLVRQAGEFKLSVASGIDWFDLDARCDFEGVSVGLPKLLEALRRGSQYVALDDGSQGMLPEQWLAKFAPLAELGEVEGSVMRFRRSQALFLDALLAAQPEAKVDAPFNRLRVKLRDFTGVSPRQQPGGFAGQLREYQQLGLGWLRFLQEFGFGGCLADDMGLGKTVQVLALLEERRTRRAKPGQPRQPSLVVAPKSLVHNWVEEAARFTPKLRVLNYTGLERNGKLGELSGVDLIVTTYATLRIDILKLKDIGFDYAILDEAQAAKNSDSQTAKACRLLKADFRLTMTGTPIENHLGELWSMFEFLNPGMLGRTTRFQALSTNGKKVATDALPQLAQALRPFLLRRTKEQVLSELPPKTEQTLFCELDATQRKLYDELRDHYRQSLDERIARQGLKKSKIQVLEALLRLRQAACHPGLLDKKQTGESSAKLDTLFAQLSEVLDAGHKALVFSQFTSLLAIVRKRLDAERISYTYLDGKTNARQKVVERFQNDDTCRLFLISLKAGGTGLNLTAADYVFILDPWWNPAVEAQAIDRAHRIGQTKPTFAYRLIASNTVEEKILELQAQKRELADAIISADGSPISQLTADDLKLLLS
ncbi:MAG: DEAD/DEAH box helicase [Planctomycetes bacterium]|nr:DEAD/DEAH box helicase [Planctomycetota bacterium]